MIADELIQQVFFYCENNNPDGCYASDVDIFEFGQKLAAVLTPMIRKEEHLRCVGIVNSLNREVATALAERRP